jgi:hypothetical protein
VAFGRDYIANPDLVERIADYPFLYQETKDGVSGESQAQFS